MELSDSKIKNISYIFSKESSSYIFVNCAVFSPSSKKLKRSTPKKKFPIFQKMELLSSNILGNENPKKASCISGNGTFQSTPRKFLILQETKTPKKLLIFSQKKAFVILQEMKTLEKFLIF